MVQELAEDLARSGSRVTIMTGFPHHGKGALFPGWRRSFREAVDQQAGFRLVRCGHSIQRGDRVASRLRYYLTFALSTLVNGLREERCDVVLSLSTPIFGSWSARLLAWFKGARFVYDIFDLHPEATRNAGLLNEKSLIYRLWRAQDSLLCRRSDAILTLSEGMKQEIGERGIPASKIQVVPFWVDPGRIAPRDRVNPWRKRQGLPDSTFIALFAGTIGHVSGAKILVETAQRLAARVDILLLVVGEGALLPEITSRALAAGLTNLRFLPFQAEEDLPDMQATADVGLVTLLPEAGRTSVPSKVLGYLAAGRPVIASVSEESETARMVQKGRCGEVVPPQDAEAFAAAIERAADNREGTVESGRSARQYFLRHYGRQACTAQYRELFQEITEQA